MKLSLFFFVATIAAATAAMNDSELPVMDEEELSEARQEKSYAREEERQQQREQQGERKLSGIDGPSGIPINPDAPFFAEYGLITEDEKIVFLAPAPLGLNNAPLNDPDDLEANGLRRPDPVNLLGSVIVTKALLLKPTSINLQFQDADGSPFSYFAGGLQPANVPQNPNDTYFFTGQCTVTAQFDDGRSNGSIVSTDNSATAVSYLPTIKAHQCLYDLCIGKRGTDCVNLYGGGGFVFNPFNRINQNPENEEADSNVITDNNEEPPLPPPFELVILGGTGNVRSVRGSATLTTLAGRTRGGRFDVNGNNLPQRGVIVQNLVVKTNIPLRAAVN